MLQAPLKPCAWAWQAMQLPVRDACVPALSVPVPVAAYAAVRVWHTSQIPQFPAPGTAYEPAAYPELSVNVIAWTSAPVRCGRPLMSLPANESLPLLGALIPVRTIALFGSPCGSWQSTHFHGVTGHVAYVVPVIPYAW